MTNETKYEVKTKWGWFRLDEGAYKDYLRGRLWINWVPGSLRKEADAPAPSVEYPIPKNISKQALELYDAAAVKGVWTVLQEYCPGMKAAAPYRRRMADIPVDELNLSVRSVNGLKRANAHTLGKLMEIMDTGTGLRAIRNLGAKSEKEIMENMFAFCYQQLDRTERQLFWQDVADGKAEPYAEIAARYK